MDPSERFIIVTGPLDGKYKNFTKKLYDDYNNYRKVVLYKTKQKGEKETPGVDGYFIDKKRFSEMVGDGNFLFYHNLPDGEFEGFSHKHASGENDWGRPLIHTCDYDEAVNFKRMLKDKCCIVYMNEFSSVKISLEENPEVSFVIEATENYDSVLSNLKYVIKKFQENE